MKQSLERIADALEHISATLDMENQRKGFSMFPVPSLSAPCEDPEHLSPGKDRLGEDKDALLGPA